MTPFFAPLNQVVQILQNSDSTTSQLRLFQTGERASLAAFVDCFPEALDLVLTNPPLSVIVPISAPASLRTW